MSTQGQMHAGQLKLAGKTDAQIIVLVQWIQVDSVIPVPKPPQEAIDYTKFE
jgi:hypothetical protein